MIIRVKGKNVINFIKRLNSYDIELLDVRYINKDLVNLKIYKKDYNQIIDLKTVYEIEKLGYRGFINVIKNIYLYKYVIVFLFVGLSIVIFLSRLIFSIEIITNDLEMKKIILDELELNGLRQYKLKKNFKELQVIKNKILEKYKDKIDWMEIKNVGTKYIVRYEPRLNNPIVEEKKLRHIIAKKSAIISSLDISEGQIVKNKNDYVKKGDIIVSGYIYLNDAIKDTVSCDGVVYGEVWYEVTVTYPLKYNEKILTGKNKTVYVIRALNNNYELFNFNKYKNKKIESKVILKNNILPFSFEKQYQEELKVKDENNNKEEAINKAIDVATMKIEDNLKGKEYILNKRVIGSFSDENTVTVKVFYSVVEDITDYQEIEEYTDLNN